MKLSYVVNANIPDDWAHSVQIMNMCKAFADNGVTVTLVVPNRKMSANNNPFAYYGMERTFSIVKIFCIDLFPGNPHVLLYWLRFISFYISARIYLWTHPSDVIYSRDLPAALFFRDSIIERHSFPRNVDVLNRCMFRLALKIVVLTSFIKDRMVSVGVAAEKIQIAPDGVDMSLFNTIQKDIAVPDVIAQASLVLGYIGTLKTMGMEKGVDDCIKSLVYLPKDRVLIVVGGESADINFYIKKSKEYGVSDRVYFTGKIPHHDIPAYIQICDVLLAPFPANEHYSYFMSPLKIFEYMASKKPIISTTLPSIQEVLTHEHNALLIPPSDPEALARAIGRLSEDGELANRISAQAYKDVEERYTWNKRAKKIINFIKT